MTLLKAAMWVHGNTVQAEFPERLATIGPEMGESVLRRGWGTLFRGGSPDPVKASNWFHIPIPTPTIMDDAKLLLKRVFVCYWTSSEEGHVKITNLHLYDGLHRATAFDDLVGYAGDHSARIDALNTWEIDPPLPIHFGLNISLGVDFGPESYGGKPTDILFTAAGADFALEA